MSEVLFANLDVSAHVLSWLLIYISQDQNIQQQLRQEVNNATDMEEYIANKNTLLHLCFVESARLRPFTGMSISFLLSFCTDDSFYFMLWKMCKQEYMLTHWCSAFSIPESSPQALNLNGFHIPANVSKVMDFLFLEFC